MNASGTVRQIQFDAFMSDIESSRLAPFGQHFQQSIEQFFSKRGHGDMKRWVHALSNLPVVDHTRFEPGHTISVGRKNNLKHGQERALNQSLMALSPWRKGPYDFCGIFVDSEWNSDLKWQRLLPHIQALAGRTVLDVGCGNGYHCFRSLGEGADFVLGVDPNLLFLIQFRAVTRYMPRLPVHLLPLKSEQMPSSLDVFDTVFSMGVLHHRRSPFDHLNELRSFLRAGGELVLESLVIEGDKDQVLVPEDRYAQMHNVWFLPSAPTLESWLKRAGFSNIRTVNVNKTTTAEQRSTAWMRFQSLSDHLDKSNCDLTVEGLPAPRRAILLAEKPS